MSWSFINSVEGKGISNPVTAAMDTLTTGVRLVVAHEVNIYDPPTGTD